MSLPIEYGFMFQIQLAHVDAHTRAILEQSTQDFADLEPRTHRPALRYLPEIDVSFYYYIEDEILVVEYFE